MTLAVRVSRGVIAKSTELLNEPCPISWITGHASTSRAVAIAQEIAEDIRVHRQAHVRQVKGLRGGNGVIPFALHTKRGCNLVCGTRRDSNVLDGTALGTKPLLLNSLSGAPEHPSYLHGGHAHGSELPHLVSFAWAVSDA